METAYSLSDIASIVGNDGFSGNNSWLLIVLFILIFGWGGNGFGRQGELGTYASNAQAQDILFNQKFSDLGAKINAIGDGICSSTYALNNSIQSEGRALQTQLATSTADTNAVVVAQTQKILDSLCTNRIADMQNQINQLQLQNAVSGVVRYPMASTYTSGVNPFCNCGCGCNNII